MRTSSIATLLLLTCVLSGSRASAQSISEEKIWCDFKDKFAKLSQSLSDITLGPGVLHLDCSVTKDRVITASGLGA